jgi:hypothetical protein
MEIVVGIVLLTVTFIVIVVVAATAAARARKEERRTELETVARLLSEPEIDEEKSVVRGRFVGLRVTYAFTSRGAGSSSVSWTEITAHVSTEGVMISLRPGQEDARVAAGEAIDVEVGDVEFDRDYVVEAAPTDRVRSIFDETLRGDIRAIHPVEITARDDTLTVAKEGWLGDTQRAGALLALCALVARHIEETGKSTATPASGIYRGDPVEVHAALEEERRSEIERLQEAVARRAAANERNTTIGCIVAVALVGGIMLLNVVILASR